MEFVNFKTLRKSPRLDLIFPAWKKAENVAFYSPHDDDALLGAGYLILATIQSGGIPHIFVFCQGDAGYSSPAEKKGIVKRRKAEAVHAYGILGVDEKQISFFNIPDFSLMAHLDRRPPWGKGLFEPMVRALRKEKISRVVFSSGHFEHWDHAAVFFAGIYTSPQAQDPILIDLGKPHAIQSYLAYSVWGDFEPAEKKPANIKADLGILASPKEEGQVLKAIRAFASQNRIIEKIVASRQKRRQEDGYLELYKGYELRKPIDYSPYFKLLKKMS